MFKFVYILTLFCSIWMTQIVGCAFSSPKVDDIQLIDIVVDDYPVYSDSTINIRVNSAMRGSPSLRFNARKRNGKVEMDFKYLSNQRCVKILDTVVDDDGFTELLGDLLSYKGELCPRLMAFDYDTKMISYSDGMTTRMFVLTPCSEFEKTKAANLYSRVVSFFGRLGAINTEDDIVNMTVNRLFGR